MENQILPCFFLIGTLAACGTQSLQKTSLLPDKVGTSVDKVRRQEGHKFLGFIPSFDKSGTGTIGPGGLSSGEILVGYTKAFEYDKGDFYETSSFFDYQDIFRGAVAFDLSSITSLSSKKIDKALLIYKAQESIIRDESGTTPEFSNRLSCARRLYTVGEEWKEGLAEGGLKLPIDKLVANLPEAPTSDGTFSIDVSKQVADWVLKPKTNIGFVLVGPLESTKTGNHYCASRLGDFELKVEYTKWGS